MARAAECAVCVDHAESTFRVEGLCCQHEAELLTRRLGTLRGVERTSTDVVRQRLLVAYDAAVTSRGAIAEAVAETGLRAFPDDESRDVRPAPSGSRVPWLAISAAALASGLAADALGAPRPWWVALLALAVAAGGATTLRRAIASARQGRLDMFVLMTVAVIGAALIGEWIEAATVVVLFALAQALERRSLDRARHAIRTLVADAPADVTRRRGAALERVPIAADRRRRPARHRPGRAHRPRRRRRGRRQRRQPGADHRRVAAGGPGRRRPRLRRHRQRHRRPRRPRHRDRRRHDAGPHHPPGRARPEHAGALAGLGRSLRRALHAGGPRAGGAGGRRAAAGASARRPAPRCIARWCCWSSPARARSC